MSDVSYSVYHFIRLSASVINEHITYGVRKHDVSYKCEFTPPKAEYLHLFRKRYGQQSHGSGNHLFSRHQECQARLSQI